MPSIDTSTYSFSIFAEIGLVESKISVPEAIDCITTASSKIFLHTEYVLGTSGSPIETFLPVGLWIFAPQIVVRMESSRPIVFIAAGFTRPAHWKGLPISSCSSKRRTL